MVYERAREERERENGETKYNTYTSLRELCTCICILVKINSNSF